MKKSERLTRGIVNCRYSVGFKVFPLIKSHCTLIRNNFEIGNKNIPPSVVRHYKNYREHDI